MDELDCCELQFITHTHTHTARRSELISALDARLRSRDLKTLDTHTATYKLQKLERRKQTLQHVCVALFINQHTG